VSRKKKETKVAKGDRDALINRLRECSRWERDPESAHADADKALLDYIGDEEVSAEYGKVEKWYS
jgi:hypothetical protein